MSEQLTLREEEVFSLLKHGFSAKAIALRLHIKHNTALSHLNRIFAKTGVSNADQAKAYIFQGEDPIAVVKARYTGWTKAGIFCEVSEQNCDACLIWRFYKLRNGKGCYQPLSNEALKSQGCKLPSRYQAGRIADVKHD